MKSLKTFTVTSLAAIGCFHGIASATATTLSKDLVWSYSQFNNEADKGRTTPNLILGIPETDAVAVYGQCAAGSSGNFSKLTVSTNVAGKTDGMPAEVTFFSHTAEHRLSGEVVGTNAEEGISGIELVINNDDPFWESVSNWYPISYRAFGEETVIVSQDVSNAIENFIADCRTYASADSQPGQSSNGTFPMIAGSWGGKVRSGPGMEFGQVGSLRNGDPIELVRNTDIMMNGYPWFQIRFSDGITGYQWGGIICGYDTPIEGAYNICERDNR